MAGNLTNDTDHYTSSFISVRYSIKDNFPFFWAALPDRARVVLEKAAKQATDHVYGQTPYDPNDKRTTQHLRDSTFYQVYSNGERGGTLYLQWRAQNPYNGWHYGINQEFGGSLNPPVTYRNYTTPGTGPGFMEEAWSVVEQMVPTLMNQEIDNLIQESSI